MYSGITQGCFPVTVLKKSPELVQYQVTFPDDLLKGLKTGASVNIDGTCQTVVAIDGNKVSFDAMQETLNLTTLSELKTGKTVSVERSLKLGDENGGHEVSGHVSTTGTIIKSEKTADNLALTIQCDPSFMKYVFYKGFIAVDGSSLTVGDVDSQGDFDLHLIPETIRLTNFGSKKVGDKVNLEFDQRTKVIVETVERYMIEKAG